MALCSRHVGSVYISCSDNIRYGFGSHLCAWLRGEKIAITNDKAFAAGTLTEFARKDAIEKSNIVIIIISKEYPSSKHCLDDFEMIMKYGEKKQILRVFYHIRSEDIISEFPEQMVKIWRNGFGENAAKDAYKVNIDRDESEIVQDITRAVSSMIKYVCSLDAQGSNDAILQSCLKRIRLEEGRRILVAEDLFGLREDLLTEIFKLRAFHDFAFCSTVCGRWRSACLNLKWSLYPPHPWSIHFQGQNIMNHLDDGRYVLEKWKIDGRYYYGCVNGWILSIGSEHISIFNLFSRTQRNLPKLSPVGYLKEQIKEPIDWYSYIEKFILFKVGQGDYFSFLPWLFLLV